MKKNRHKKEPDQPASVRDLLVEQSAKIDQLLTRTLVNAPQNGSRKAFPLALTRRQRDALDIVYEEISKPFTLEELVEACNHVEPGFGVRAVGLSATVRAYLTERAGMKVRWRG